MQTRSGAEIVVDGDVVYKLHRPGTDPSALATRLRIAAESDFLLTSLDPRPEYAPWAEAGRLLAHLHGESTTMRLPHGWPQRLRRMLRSTDDATVRRAAAELPPEVWRAGSPDRPATLVHGDWHLGQLGRLPASEPWVLTRRGTSLGLRVSGRPGSSPTTTGSRSWRHTGAPVDPPCRRVTRGKCSNRSLAQP